MKCVGLLVFVFLIQSINVVIQAQEIGDNDEYDEATVSTTDEELEKEQNEIKYPSIWTEGQTQSVKDIVGNLIKSYFSLRSTLNDLTGASSPNLLSVSSKLFRIVDPLTNISGSSSHVLTSLNRALPEAFSSITEIVSDLAIETPTLTDAIENLLKSLTIFIHIVDDIEDIDNLLKSTPQHDGIVDDFKDMTSAISEKLDATITSIETSVQSMVNTISVSAAVTTKAIGSVSTELQEAIVSLTLVLTTVLVIVQSVCISFTCIVSPIQTVSSTLNTFVSSMDGLLQGITDDITSVINLTKTSLSVATGMISVTLTQLTTNFIASLEGSVTSSVSKSSNSLEKILTGLYGSVSDIPSSVTESVALITSSVKTVSSSDSGLLSAAAKQLNSIFEILSKLTGSDYAIVTTLVDSVPGIFKTLKAASNSLVSGIGADPISVVTNFIRGIEKSLRGFLPLMNDESKKLNDKVVEEFVKAIAKDVQYVVSTVAAIASTVSETSHNLRNITLESVLALQFIISTNLYVLQWALSLTTSILTRNESKNLSELTLLLTDTIQSSSKIAATISGSISENLSLSDIVSSITSSVKHFGATVSSKFKLISGVVASIVVDQSSGSEVKESTPGITNETTGTVLQILSGLTGALGSISPTLSSSLSTFATSLKVVSSSYAKLHIINNLLSVLATQIAVVRGPASEILSLISSQLDSFFKSISSLFDKFSILGDVAVSLNKSTSDISTALSQLIDAIDYLSAENLSDLDDPVKVLTKNVQILISTFIAIFEAADHAGEDEINSLSEVLLPLPFIIFTIISTVQQVLGAAIASMSVTFQNSTLSLQHLTLRISEILKSFSSLIKDIATLLSDADIPIVVVLSEISAPLLQLGELASSSLGAITGLTANIKVSLGGASRKPNPEL